VVKYDQLQLLLQSIDKTTMTLLRLFVPTTLGLRFASAVATSLSDVTVIG
jgi:hypothetical protein